MKQESRQWIFLRDVYRKGDDSENLADDISPGQDCGYPRAFRAGPHRTPGSGYHLSVCFITLWQVVNTFEVIQMNFTIIIIRDKDRPAPPNTPGTAGCPRTVIKRVGTALLGHTRLCLQRLPEVLGKPVVHTPPHKNNPSLRSGPFEPVKTRLAEVKGSRVGSSGAWHSCAPR